MSPLFQCYLVQWVYWFICVWKYTIPWWHHQMETFSSLLALFEGNHRSKGPVTRRFDMFFGLHLKKKRLGEQSRCRWFEMPSRSLWRHCYAPSMISHIGFVLIGLSSWRHKVLDSMHLWDQLCYIYLLTQQCCSAIILESMCNIASMQYHESIGVERSGPIGQIKTESWNSTSDLISHQE